MRRRTGDLSSTFGAAAAGLPPARRRRPDPAEDESRSGDQDAPTSRSRTGPARTGTGAPRRARPPERRRTDPVEKNRAGKDRAGKDRPAPSRRRAGPLRIRDPHQLDLLLLAVIERRPGNGDAVHGLLRDLSHGAFDPSAQGLYRRLHKLRSNRLITRDAPDRRYTLTPLGNRILAAWRREWAAFSSGVDDVLGRDDRA
ncbi:MAG: PadR family transcriptional regulator [Pseudonocardia sp.]|nr:PadR family transcriptional regulator [Pseudonocardia sp.]